MSKVYVQPLYHAAVSEFVSYAKAEGYNIEVATFAYTNVHDMDWQKALQDHQQLLKEFEGQVSFHGIFQEHNHPQQRPPNRPNLKRPRIFKYRSCSETGCKTGCFPRQPKPARAKRLLQEKLARPKHCFLATGSGKVQ
jgi:hypothetical protein